MGLPGNRSHGWASLLNGLLVSKKEYGTKGVWFSIDRKDFVFGIHGVDDMSRIHLQEVGARRDVPIPVSLRRGLVGLCDPLIQGEGNIEIFGQHEVGEFMHRAMNVGVSGIPAK